MLQVRYNSVTRELTGWWGSRFGNEDIKLKNRPTEAIVVLDIPLPEKPLEAWLYDEATESLVSNPSYVDPSIVDQDQVDYAAAVSVDQKLTIIARKLGLL